MSGRRTHVSRKSKPDLESLETRRLLNARTIAPNGLPINDKDLLHALIQKNNNVPVSDRRLAYTTPEGTKVQVTLFGFGSLAGSTVRPDGSLDLVYKNTLASSKIVGHVQGGTGSAPLASLRDANVAPGSPSATGSDPINVVNLKKFNLIPGGYINIEGGVGTLALASAAQNSQIHVAALPASATSSSSSNPTSTTVTTTTTPGTTAGSVGTTGTTGTTTGTTGTATVTTGTSTGTTGTVIAPGLTSTGQAIVLTPTTVTSNRPPTPTGPEISIPIVNGAPRSTPIGNAQIFGYDPTAGNLIRFDAVTGNVVQTIPVPATGSPIAGVGLGRNNGRLVALVGIGQTIFAYDAVTGAAVGSFSTASLGAVGLTRVDGIGSSDTKTFVSDSSDGPGGVAQGIDVTASLRTGSAVAVGAPFIPNREFELSGGLTGLAGSDVIYASGAGHFDTAVPDRLQLGVVGFVPGALLTRESSRASIPSPTGGTIDAGPVGSVRSRPTAALGSVGTNLALNIGVINNQNVVDLLTPSGLTTVGTVSLNDPNRLAGLSESFHPELDNAVLVDVTGNLRRFTGHQATGLVVNASGAVNLIQIDSATDSALIGRPLNHIDIGKRTNVVATSSARGTRGIGTRGGVTVNATALPLGPLTLP